ncbi:MAG: carboxypeptidase-like regulatory domain-containing protein [Gemmatimonadales bacterium]
MAIQRRSWWSARPTARPLATSVGVLIAAAALPAATASAQGAIVVGVVRDAGTARPIPGALIAALDSSGHVVVRVLSNEQGRFVVTRGASAALRVTRIGYTPSRRALGNDRPAGDTLIVTLDRIPAMLDAVRVSTGVSCSGSGTEAALALWEQARAGLEAMVVARETNPASAVSMTFSSIINVADSEVVQLVTREHEGTVTRPFRARADPAEFARAGYVEPAGRDLRLFSAPDADILLDPTFAASHCFSVATDQVRGRARVGLVFRPSNHQSSVVDVAGTLWFTVDPLSLDELLFSYVEPPGAEDSVQAGGSLVFRTMPNGVTFIREWSIRTPATAVDVGPEMHLIEGATVRRIGGTSDRPRPRLRVTQWRETGGRVLSAGWADGSHTADSLGGIIGFVEQRETHRAAEHVPVVLRATGDTVFTDTSGLFEFDRLLPGRYAVVARDTTFGEYTGEEPTVLSVFVREGMRASVIARVADPDNALTRLCPALDDVTPRSILLGRVRAAHFDAAWEIGASWQDDYALAGSAVGIKAAGKSIHPDAGGRYFVCGVVRERPIRLGVWLGKQRLLDTTVIVGNVKVQRVDLVMPLGANRS